jgi:hypothetical protein
VCACVCVCKYLTKICSLLVDTENGRAYPDYLVRYYRGKRDPKRSPYESKQDVAADVIDADAMETGLVEGVSWEYLDNSGWEPYGSSHQSILENAYQAAVGNTSTSSKVQIQTDKWAYEVDVENLIQMNMDLSDCTKRSVRRAVSVVS